MKKIYCDYQATTPCDKLVVEKMLPYFSEKFGNPHSRNHHFGWEAEEGVEQARLQVAKSIGANPKDIIFTSGATESNNIAIKGVANFYQENKKHIITCVTEHKCVLESCRYLEQQGFKITYLPVQSNGIIKLSDLEQAITEETVLVSIMMVNNEIGVIQPVEEIGKICRSRKVFFHTDAAQSLGKIPINVDEMNIDLLSLSSHKIYGPKGIGALYVRRKPRVRIKSIISGGGQERSMRSGTLSPALCVGFGHACEISIKEMNSEYKRITVLRDLLYKLLHNELDEIYLNGDAERRVPGNLNLSFAFVEGEGLLMGLKEIALSSGSACTSASLEPSYVLKALGVDEEMAHTSLRIGIGRYTTEEEINYVAKKIIEVVKHLRNMSPLWEMHKEGVDFKSVQWVNNH